MKENANVTVEEKEPGKVKKWLSDHTLEILLGVLTVGSGAAGVVLSKDYFYSKGYAKGLVEFRKQHIDTVKIVMDESAHEAAFQALNFVRKDGRNYKELLDNPDSVIQKIGDIFYNSEYAKNLNHLYDSELKEYAKLMKK